MKKVLSYGEILWDVIDGEEKIGGAPFNLAGHLARLGTQAFLYSKVGADELGRRALQEIARLGVRPNYVETDTRYPTGTALVRPAGGSRAIHSPKGSATSILKGMKRRLPPSGMRAFPSFILAPWCRWRSNPVKRFFVFWRSACFRMCFLM